MGETNGLKKELSLTSLIAMASGGMVAAWMVEIRYWFELTGVTSALALLVCALLILPLCFIYTEMTAMLPYAGGANIWELMHLIGMQVSLLAGRCCCCILWLCLLLPME